MLETAIQAYHDHLLEQMENTLAQLAWYWRGLPAGAEAQEIVRRYQSILECLLSLGLDHPLTVDSELPHELMPVAYFERFSEAP
jgi:hypothetical protein